MTQQTHTHVDDTATWHWHCVPSSLALLKASYVYAGRLSLLPSAVMSSLVQFSSS